MNIRENSMIKIMSYLFLCIFILSSCKKHTTSDLDIFNLKGNVKSVTFHVYHDKEKYERSDWNNYCVGIPTYSKDFIYKFDKKGKWINSFDNIERDEKGRIVNLGKKCTFNWNEDGELVLRDDHDWEYEGPGTSIEYYYDNNGKIARLQYNDGGEGGQEHTYRYKKECDEHGNWLFVNVDRFNPVFEYYDSSISIERTITYWEKEEEETMRKDNVYPVDHDEISTESSSKQNYISSYNTNNNITSNFRTEMNVRSFLCRYTFKDYEGNRITFSNMGNQLEMNGSAMTSTLTVLSFGNNEAELKFQGPYGRSSFFLAVEDGEAGIMDRNEGTIYYAK